MSGPKQEMTRRRTPTYDDRERGGAERGRGANMEEIIKTQLDSNVLFSIDLPSGLGIILHCMIPDKMNILKPIFQFFENEL